jgi:hypothetical protein
MVQQVRLLVQHGEAVDDSAARHRHVADRPRRPPAIAGAVAGDVHHQPRGPGRASREQTKRRDQPLAQGRGAGARQAGRGLQRLRDKSAVSRARDALPGQRHLLIVRPVERADRHGAARPARRGGDHIGIEEGAAEAVHHQRELVVIDARGDVDREHESHIHIFHVAKLASCGRLSKPPFRKSPCGDAI